jgi:hypothetical protein
VGRKGDPALPTARLDAWAQGLTAFRERRFGEAKAIFTALEGEAAEPVVALYLERCERALATPPPADWDGTGPD